MKKTKLTMPSAFTTLLIITVIITILTYIIPAGKYEYVNNAPVAGTYHQVASNPQGFFDIAKAPVKGFIGAIDIGLFIMVMGGCLGVIFETKAIDAALIKVSQKLKGREKILIPILMIICSLGGTTYGMSEETIAFYPLVLPILIAAGYDVVTGVMVIFVGAGIGVLGGITNPFSVGIGSNIAGISIGDGMLVRAILYLSYLIFGIWFVMRYAAKIKKDPTKSVVHDIRDLTEAPFKKNLASEDLKFTTKRKLIISIFMLMFVVMIIGIIPWSSKFNIHIFENLDKNIRSIPLLGNIIGHVPPLGEWYFTEMTTLFFIGSVLIGKIYGYKENEIVRLFILGVKDIIGVALVLGVAKGLYVIMNDSMIIGTILHTGETILSNIESKLFPAIAYILYIPISLLIPSSSGLQTATIPILAPLADFVHIGKEYIVMACQAGSETMNLFSPTQAVLIGTLAITNIPYIRWLKHILPFIGGIILITVVGLTLGSIFL